MDNPAAYFATPPVNLIYAYDKALEIVLEEGMERREQRHLAYGRAVRTALRTYGMMPLADETVAAPTLSCMLYPEGVNDAAFRNGLAARGVIVAGSLAHLAGKAFRIGHMGNTKEYQLVEAIKIIGDTLKEQGVAVDLEEAVKVFKETIVKEVEALL